MYKAVSFWSAPKPEDEEAFEEYYWSTHVALAQKVLYASRLILTRTSDGLGDAPAFYRVAEMLFESKDDFDKATQTEEWAAMREDAHKVIERFGVSLQSGLGTPQDVNMIGRR